MPSGLAVIYAYLQTARKHTTSRNKWTTIFVKEARLFDSDVEKIVQYYNTQRVTISDGVQCVDALRSQSNGTSSKAKGRKR